jgi:hypothetical protein
MHIKVSDIIAFGALVLTALTYMNVGRKPVVWLLLIVGFVALAASILSRTKHEKTAGTTMQSATASGNSTINQAGRDVIINEGVSEATVRKILSAKAISANKELAKKYPLGCVLMGITEGKVIFESDSSVFQFDPENKVTIAINDAKKQAAIDFVLFKITTIKGKAVLQIDACRMRISYVENVPRRLMIAFTLPDGIKAYPFVEVLDEANKVFVLGFKPTPQ